MRGPTSASMAAVLLAEFAEIVDPVVRFPAGHFLVVAVAIPDGADFHAGATARFHVGGGIAHEEALFGVAAEALQRTVDDVGFGLARETVGTLDVLESRQEFELVEDGSGCGRAFGGGCAF